MITGEWTEETFAEWDADDDPIIAEIRQHRQEILAEFDFDGERYWRSLLERGIVAEDHPDLDTYNADARRRALVLGFPPETFVIRRDQFPRDWKDARDAEEKLAEPPADVLELPLAADGHRTPPDSD